MIHSNYMKTIVASILLCLFLWPSSVYSQCISGDCHQGQGVFLFEDGSRYSGDFQNRRPHGTGWCEYADGARYQGDWKDGRPHGKGTLRLKNGQIKQGYWENGAFVTERLGPQSIGQPQKPGCISGDCKRGNGVYVYSDGSRYEGAFLGRKPHGKGDFIYANGDHYTGDFQAGYREGSGRMVRGSGVVQDGYWRGGDFVGKRPPRLLSKQMGCLSGNCQNGYGTYRFPDGAFYKGTFADGKAEGRGEVDYVNGERYSGEMKAGHFHGYGTLYRDRGLQISGFWEVGEYLGDQPRPNIVPTEPAVSPVVKRNRPKIWAVVIGIGAYTHMPTLRFTDDDAYRMYAFLKSPEGGALPDDQIRILIDEDATKHRIMETMTNLFSQVGSEDLILLYYSGHGLKGAFLPIDFDGYRQKLWHEEINNILAKSPAKYKICIADACHSGSLLASRSGGTSALDDYYRVLGKAAPGTALIMSSKSEETSLESSGLRQGVFSHYFIRGLKGEADFDRNKTVTISELYNYVLNEVRAYTNNRQSPIIQGDYDENMPVSVIR